MRHIAAGCAILLIAATWAGCSGGSNTGAGVNGLDASVTCGQEGEGCCTGDICAAGLACEGAMCVSLDGSVGATGDAGRVGSPKPIPWPSGTP